jgi:transcriptional regulator with GAF, ATPase, and Fis domain
METSREQAIIRALVEMADNLVENFDVVDLLTSLAGRCVHLLGVSAAGVMINVPSHGLRLVASSSEELQVVELFELQADEGPSLEAFHSGEAIEQARLRSRSEHWPRFSEVAVAAGYLSVCALPLRLRDSTIGALSMFSVEHSPMDEGDLRIARALADLATISILQHGEAMEGHRLNEHLSTVLATRVVIEQAKGVISERAGIDVSEAFVRLLSYARSDARHLADVARSAIDGTLDARAWAAPPAVDGR